MTAPMGHKRVLVLTRGGARICVELSTVSEVGRIPRLTRTRHAHEAVLGTLVLHGASVPVADVAYAVGAVSERAEEAPMFVATRSQPVVCFAADECEGIQSLECGGAQWRTHEMISEWLVLHGESLPVIDAAAVAKAVGSAPSCVAEARRVLTV